jgi:tight adherence protein B
MGEFLIPAGIFVAVTVFMAAIFFIFKDFSSSSTEDRLEILTGQKKPDNEDQGIMKGDMMSSPSGGFATIFTRFFKNVENFRLFFEQADSPMKIDQFFMVSGGCVVVGAVLGWASKAPVPLWPVFGLAIGFVPFLVLWMKRRRRFKQFAKQLPDAMELIARALRSGHSLNSGIHVVVEEMPTPISTEFLIAYEEQNLGIPIEQALKTMLKRMPNMDLKFFVTAVAIQKQAGGDLAEVLDKIGYIIRERFKIMGMVRSNQRHRAAGYADHTIPSGLLHQPDIRVAAVRGRTRTHNVVLRDRTSDTGSVRDQKDHRHQNLIVEF